MNLFGSSNDCGKHHWTDGMSAREWRLESGYNCVELHGKYRYKCVHDGCDVTKTEWEPMYKGRRGLTYEYSSEEVAMIMLAEAVHNE